MKEQVRLKTFEVENHLERIYINGTNLFNDAWFINIQPSDVIKKYMPNDDLFYDLS